MLFKRIIERKSVLKIDNKKAGTRKSELEDYRNDERVLDTIETCFSVLEETMKMAVLGFMLWAGIMVFGNHVAPYPLNLIIATDPFHPPPMYDVPFPSAEKLKKLPHIKSEHIKNSMEFAQSVVNQLQLLEENIHSAGIEVEYGTPAHGMLLTGYPTDEAMQYDKSSYIVSKASLNLIYSKCSKYGVSMEECASLVSTLNLGDDDFGAECALLERFTCGTQKKSSRFRTFDGSCNNPVRSSWGQAMTGYRRLLHPKYGDGIIQPRYPVNTQNGGLPSPRKISQLLVSEEDKTDDSRTIALAIWSQFVQHDISHTPVKRMLHHNYTIRCCRLNSGFHLQPRYRHPSCFPISIPPQDPFYGAHNIDCMEYTRSVTTYRGDCTFGAAEQMNQVSHFLDGSPIYGSSARESASLRSSNGGTLKVHLHAGEEFLPLHHKPMEKCMVDRPDRACFRSGDIRSNMNPWLASLHTLMLREHNRLARALSQINQDWGNDRLFHEARRLLIAQLQHITYHHWIPALMGKHFDDDNYETEYNPDTNPTVTNSVATTAFSFVNSLLDGDIEIKDTDGNTSNVVRMGKHYYQPDILLEDDNMDGILRGMVSQFSQAMDLSMDKDLRNGLFSSSGIGADVFSISVQKEREHGLPPYVSYRAMCSSSTPASFSDLADVMSTEAIERLKSAYSDVRDVDIIAGVLAEKPLQGSIIGPTLTCLLKEQLWRLRSGDRYFYTHSQSENRGAFTRRQLSELKKTSLAAILCQNSNVKQVQLDVFMSPSASNPVVSCNDIKKINLEMWRDPAQQPDLITRTQKWIKTKVTG